MSVFPLWYCLSAPCQDALAKAYKRRFRRPFLPPGRRPQIESPEEIARLMKQPTVMEKVN